MSTHRSLGLLCALLLGLSGMFPGAAWADHFGQSQILQGLEVDLGIVPARIMRENPDQYPEHEIDAIPSGKNSYHVLVAIFDRSSGERITEAQVDARVSPLGLTGSRKDLEPMSIDDAVTYCNFFNFSKNDIHRVLVRIRRPGRPSVAEATFELWPHRQ